MTKNKIKHISVMKQEVIESLNIKQNGVYIDATFGMGGHTYQILKMLGKNGKLYAFDKDPESIAIGKTIQDARFYIMHQSFSHLLQCIKNIKIHGIIFDLGVSSLQIDNKKRGFSFQQDGPLDMRMNPNHGISASDWLFKSSIKDISYVLKNFGEERFSRRIAYAIKNRNQIQKITRTLELVNVIKRIIPIKNNFQHPARRTFQAIRIYINRELEEIKKGLEDTLKILHPGGRLSVISFHSLEDRIVKRFIRKHSQTIIPHGLPITENDLEKLKLSKLRIINRIFPKKTEIIDNPRSRSAILRVAEMK